MFAESIIVSSSLLTKKPTGLTGEQPGKIFKSLSLNKAAKMYDTKYGNISEIVYKCGLTNPHILRHVFKNILVCLSVI